MQALASKKIAKQELLLAFKGNNVSAYMIERMAAQNVSVSRLQTAFKERGRKAVEFILKESVSNKARVTAKPKIVDAIVQAVEKSLNKDASDPHHQSGEPMSSEKAS